MNLKCITCPVPFFATSLGDTAAITREANVAAHTGNTALYKMLGERAAAIDQLEVSKQLSPDKAYTERSKLLDLRDKLAQASRILIWADVEMTESTNQADMEADCPGVEYDEPNGKLSCASRLLSEHLRSITATDLAE